MVEFVYYLKTRQQLNSHAPTPPEVCIAIISNFSWVISRPKRNRRQWFYKILGGKQGQEPIAWQVIGSWQGALWSMWKWWIKEAIMSQKHSHSADRHMSDRVSRATLNWRKGSSFSAVSLLSAWGETIKIQREATSLAVSVWEEVRYKNNNYASRLKWSWMLREELYIIDDVLNGDGNVLTGSCKEEQCWLHKKLNFWMNVHWLQISLLVQFGGKM